jgi:hypothetical protein
MNSKNLFLNFYDIKTAKFTYSFKSQTFMETDKPQETEPRREVPILDVETKRMNANKEAIARNPMIVAYIASVLQTYADHLEKTRGLNYKKLWITALTSSFILQAYSASIRGQYPSDMYIPELFKTVSTGLILYSNVVVAFEISAVVRALYKYPEWFFQDMTFDEFETFMTKLHTSPSDIADKFENMIMTRTDENGNDIVLDKQPMLIAKHHLVTGKSEVAVVLQRALACEYEAEPETEEVD